MIEVEKKMLVLHHRNLRLTIFAFGLTCLSLLNRSSMNIIITGASRGLGYAIAEIFGGNGNDLFLTSVNESKLSKAVGELQNKYPGITIKAKPFDLGKKEQALEFGEWCLENSSPDVLVNNAGSFAGSNVHNEVDGALEEMSGHIFNMSSIAGLKAYPNGGSYSISKFAMRGFSINLRDELKRYNIK